MPDLERLGRLAETEFLEIVLSTTITEEKLRVVLVDGSYIDFWWSGQIQGRYPTTGSGARLTEPSTGTTTFPTCVGKR